MIEGYTDASDEGGLGAETDLILSLLAILIVVGLIFWVVMSRQQKEAERVRDEAVAEVARLRVEAEQLKDELKKKTGTVQILSISEKKNFDVGSARLKADIQDKDFLKGIDDARNQLLSGEYQQIEIVGNSSPESLPPGFHRVTSSFRLRLLSDDRCTSGLAGAGLDFNTRLAYCRAVSVALHFKNKHRIPMDCMLITGAGRSQSEVMNQSYKSKTPQETEDLINSENYKKENAEALGNERRITVSLTRRPKENRICIEQLRHP